jgi:hypothetical protein
MLSPAITIIDYAKVRNEYRYACGFVSIAFRKHTDPSYDINFGSYILNSGSDGWFRKDNENGVSSRHGLCIDHIKITGRNPAWVGDFLAYKCVIEYTTAEETQTHDLFWLYVHKEFSVETVLAYIEEHKGDWTP